MLTCKKLTNFFTIIAVAENEATSSEQPGETAAKRPFDIENLIQTEEKKIPTQVSKEEDSPSTSEADTTNVPANQPSLLQYHHNGMYLLFCSFSFAILVASPQQRETITVDPEYLNLPREGKA